MGTETKIKLIKKHAAAIHCVNSLSLLQRKISNAFLYYAYYELLEKDEHTIAISDLCSIIGYNSNNYAVIKDSIKGLITTLLEWNLVDDDTGEEDWTATTMLASVHIKGRYCTYSYSPQLKKLFHNPSIYGKINLIVQARFKSSYGLALYENCARYRGLPNTKWFPLELFRRLMGVSNELYPIFRDFKRRVIDKAVEEVNVHSDIFVEPILDRVGQKVVRIKFNLKERPKKEKLGLAEPLCQSTSDAATHNSPLLIQLIEQFRIPQGRARLLLEQYDETYINQKITMLLNSNSFQRGQIESLSGYLLKALQEDYTPAVGCKEMIHEQYQQQAVESQQKQQKLNQEKELRKAYQQFSQDTFFEQYHQINQDLRSQMLNLWWQQIDSQNMTAWFKKFYDKHGIQHPAIYTALSGFLQETYAEYFQPVISFEEFIQRDIFSLQK